MKCIHAVTETPQTKNNNNSDCNKYKQFRSQETKQARPVTDQATQWLCVCWKVSNYWYFTLFQKQHVTTCLLFELFLFEWCYTVFLEQRCGVSEVACVSSVWMMLYSVPWTTLWCFRSGMRVFCLNDAIQCSLNNSVVFQKWRACLLFEWCYTVFLEQLFGVSEVACVSSVWMMLYSVPWTTLWCFRSGVRVFCLNDAIQCSLNNSLVFQKWRACLLFEWCYTVFLEQLFGVSEVACVSSVWMMLYSVPWTTLWCFRSGVRVFCLNDAIQCSLNNFSMFQKRRVSFADPIISGESPAHEATLNKVPGYFQKPDSARRLVSHSCYAQFNSTHGMWNYVLRSECCLLQAS